MANLDSLNYTSITEMSIDEALELIRQIRLSRRIPVKKVKKTTSRKKSKAVPNINAQQAAELLKILTESRPYSTKGG